MYPIFVFAKCCWSIHSKVVRLGKNAHSKQRKVTPHKLCSFTSSYLHALIVQYLYNVFVQCMVWHGPTPETAWMQRRQKNWRKYTDFTELKKITSRIFSNFSNYSSLFLSLSNFVFVRFLSKTICSFLSKNNLQLVFCTSGMFILLFTSQYRSKE